jgi:hypothetical protein
MERGLGIWPTMQPRDLTHVLAGHPNHRLYDQTRPEFHRLTSYRATDRCAIWNSYPRHLRGAGQKEGQDGGSGNGATLQAGVCGGDNE